MSTTTFPRVETIVVPNNIRSEQVGKYVTQEAHRIISEVGAKYIIPRSARLSALSSSLFLLSFESPTPYVPKTMELVDINSSEPRDVEGAQEVSGGTEDRPVKTGKRGATR